MSKIDMTFEEAIKKLEKIALALENEKIELDESLKLYEEGVKLVRYCNKLIEWFRLPNVCTHIYIFYGAIFDVCSVYGCRQRENNTS